MSIILSPVKLVTIDSNHQGQRIDNYLGTALKDLPKSRIYRLLRKGEVRVNKKRIDPDYRLIVGDIVRLPPIKKPESVISVPSKVWMDRLAAACLYEDEDLLILNKPAGLAVHGGTEVAYGVIDILRQAHPEYPFLELAHRLDRETSGCLVLARNRTALLALHEAFKDKTTEKYYQLWVHGRWPVTLKTVNLPLLKSGPKGGERRVQVNHEAGQRAVTHFKVLRYWGHYTCLEAKLETGRTHQIRVHAASSGHPIVGDGKYGERNKDKIAKRLGFQGVSLHAVKIVLPLKKGGLSIEAPLPEDWFVALE